MSSPPPTLCTDKSPSRLSANQPPYPPIPDQPLTQRSRTEKARRMLGKGASSSARFAGTCIYSAVYAAEAASAIGHAIVSPSSTRKSPSFRSNSATLTDSELDQGWKEYQEDASQLLENTRKLQIRFSDPNAVSLWSERYDLLLNFGASIPQQILQSNGPRALGCPIDSQEELLVAEAHCQAALGWEQMPYGKELDKKTKQLFDAARAASVVQSELSRSTTNGGDDMAGKFGNSGEQTIG